MTKKEFDLRLEQLGLSRKDFAELSGIAYKSMSSNWKEDKEVPSWVEPFLNLYEKALKLDLIVQTLKPLL